MGYIVFFLAIFLFSAKGKEERYDLWTPTNVMYMFLLFIFVVGLCS